MDTEKVIVAFLCGFNDRDSVEGSLDLLDDSFDFKNPWVHMRSKSEFLSWTDRVLPYVVRLEVLEVVQGVDVDLCVALYAVELDCPGADRILITEWFRLDNGRIISSHMFLDASRVEPYRKRLLVDGPMR